MRIHKEGYSILFFSFILLALINALVYWVLPIFFPLTLLGAFFLFGLELNFFRHPHRNILQPDAGLIYAPADGKIVVIEEVMDEEYAQQKRLQVSIFMSIYDVHANRSPIAGKVIYFKYHPGKYLLARHPKSSTENERNTFVIEQEKGTILIRQIAGAVARRIRSYVKLGDFVAPGQEIGFIKFGSRADLLLPLNAEIKVQLGQKVKAGIDIIATW